MSQLAVEAEGVFFRYDSRPSSRRRKALPARGDGGAHASIIDDLNLRISPGEIVGLLGPNGGGKSTLLRLLSTALRPTDGTLTLLGREAAPPDRALRRAIGYAADTPVHIEALSGRANALALARAAGMSNAAALQAVDGLFERLSLTADAHRAVREYSHGMRRKVLVTEALAHEPQLILLDEPALGLDPPAAAELNALVRERAADGAAVILATHELDTASRLCDRVIFMLDGRLALDGRPDALLRAIDPGTRIRIALHAPLVEPLEVEDIATVRAGAKLIELRTAAGAAVLPALCAALIRKDAQVHTIELREPDLRDVFMSVTGMPWVDVP